MAKWKKISAQISSYTLTSTIERAPEGPLNPDYTASRPVYIVKVTSMALQQRYNIIIFKYILFIIMVWTSWYGTSAIAEELVKKKSFKNLYLKKKNKQHVMRCRYVSLSLQ